MSIAEQPSSNLRSSDQESLVAQYCLGIFEERCLRKHIHRAEAATPHVMEFIKQEAVTKFRHIGPALEAYCAEHPTSRIFDNSAAKPKARYSGVTLQELQTELAVLEDHLKQYEKQAAATPRAPAPRETGTSPHPMILPTPPARPAVQEAVAPVVSHVEKVTKPRVKKEPRAKKQDTLKKTYVEKFTSAAFTESRILSAEDIAAYQNRDKGKSR